MPTAPWPVHPLREVADVYVGLVTSRRLDPTFEVPLIPIIGVRDLNGDGGVAPCDLLESLPLTPGRGVDSYRVHPGEVLVTSRGTQLKVGLVSYASEGAVLTNNLLGLRPREGLLSEVLLAWLLGSQGQSALMGLAQSGTGLLSLPAAAIAAMPVPVPPMDVQRQIAELVTATQAYHAAAIAAAEAHRRLSQAVVSDLFRATKKERL